jgi:hypothetical protein
MAKAVEPTAALYVVRSAFAIFVDGKPTVYAEGEIVDPSDPLLKTMPEKFTPLVYPHPVKRTAPPVIEQATAAPGEKRGA